MSYTPKHLGKTTEYPKTFDASLLEAIPRAPGRHSFNFIDGQLPFIGTDLWQAYEMSWLTLSGQGAAAVVDLHIPVGSPSIVESKSLKLYLQSFHMTQFDGANHVERQIEKDLSILLETTIAVRVNPLKSGMCAEGDANLWSIQQWQDLEQPYITMVNVDQLDYECSIYEPDAGLLVLNSGESQKVTLAFTDCFRSLCPVTGQPDFASIAVLVEPQENYCLDLCSLGQYFNSYRLHQGFHEQCVETIFMDILNLGGFEKLSVVGRFTRRGGIDINPARHLNAESEALASPYQLRQVRQ